MIKSDTIGTQDYYIFTNKQFIFVLNYQFSIYYDRHKYIDL